MLTSSGPISVGTNGQVVEYLRITSSSGTALDINADNVVIRNVEILHANGKDISINGADNVLIQNVSVENTGVPTSGPAASSDENNISGYGALGLVIENVRLNRGSAGIYLISSPGAQLRFVEGYDFRGPYPRGQVVQFNKCDNALLEDFSVINPNPDYS